MSWQLLMIISVSFSSFSTLAQRTMMKDNKGNSFSFSILFQTMGAILIGVFGVLFQDMTYPSLLPVFWNLALMASLYGIGSVFMFKALEDIEASAFTVLFSVSTIFSIVGATIFLDEGLSSTQIIGAISILAGVILVSYKSLKLDFDTGEVLTLVAALCFGLAIVNDRYILSNSDFEVFPFLTLGYFLPVIPMILINPKAISGMKIFFKRNVFSKILLFTLLYVIHSITFYLALQKSENTSQISSVGKTSTVLTVLLAIIFLKEQTKLQRKLIGVILSFLGLLLIT